LWRFTAFRRGKAPQLAFATCVAAFSVVYLVVKVRAMITMLKFYHASGDSPEALLDQAEDQINAALLNALPSGTSVQSIVPQFTREGDRLDLLVTVLISLSNVTAHTASDQLTFRLRGP
jgi:hypothetical protein